MSAPTADRAADTATVQGEASSTDAITDAIYQMSFATLPGAKLKRIDDSAHFIMFDQPEVFAAEVDAFLTSN